MRNSLKILFVSLISVSCTPYHRITKGFMRGKTSIEYIHTSKSKSERNKNIPVTILKPVITDLSFKSGSVKNVKAVVIPLIIYNGWNYEYECAIGHNQVKENLNSFIQSSLVEEANRMGLFKADTIANNSYSIEVEVDSMRSAAIHKTSGFFAYFFFFALRQNSTQANVTLAY